MMRTGTLFFAAVLLTLSCCAWAGESATQDSTSLGDSGTGSLWDSVCRDYGHFYSGGGLLRFAIGLGATGIFANTSADSSIRDWYQDSVRAGWTDDVAKVAKPFGEGTITVPVYIGAALLGNLAGSSGFGEALGEWGERSLRTLLVGAPPMLFFQSALGASRPEEGDSHWHFFQDNNAVSGHAFMGAVPFLTAAGMVKSPVLKAFLYCGSALPALSRINDDAHYFSQAALGWWIGYLAASSIERTETQKQAVTIVPVPVRGGLGVVVSFDF
jgi:membrane-associated phospholipid phosphatase